MKLRISVTEEILNRSKNCNDETAFNCAIALAVRDIFPLAAVFTNKISLFNRNQFGNPFIRIDLPNKAAEFIDQFDNSTPEQRSEIQPISFEIDVPDEVINRINISEITELLKDHPTLQII